MADNLASFFATDYIVSGETYKARMEEAGYTVVIPAPNELQIDIDTIEQKSRFYKLFSDLCHEMAEDQPIITRGAVSESGYPKRHFTIKMPFPMDNLTRIAFQASLGSDSRRELMSLIQHLAGDSIPTLFKEVKDADNSVVGNHKHSIVNSDSQDFV